MRPATAVVTGAGLAVAGLRGIGDLLEPPAACCESGPALELGLGGQGMRHKDRASRLALGATGSALRDAGLLADGRAAGHHAQVAVVASTNFGNLDSACEFTDTIRAETVTGLSPMRIPHMSSNVTACWVAIEYGLGGPNITLCNGTTSGLDAMFWARNLIAVRRADVAVVVGVEPDTKPVAELHRSDGGRSWLDGAAAVVVESAEHAARRGAGARAQVGGYGRGIDVPAAVAQARRSDPRPVGRCLAATQVDLGGPADGAAEGIGPVDLTARLGRCSGALGVLQAAAALAWLDRGEVASVLAVAGAGAAAGEGDPDGEGDPSGVAALLLTRPADPSQPGWPERSATWRPLTPTAGW
jgi:3-oxoacyl-[acyl-carrier-protein] synthase II